MSPMIVGSEVEGEIIIKDIMTHEILFYEDEFTEDCKKYCKERNITYLPSVNDPNNIVHKLVEGEFEEQTLEERQKISQEIEIFDKELLEKFEEPHVLFVYQKNKLVGVVHFSDYNRNPVFIYIYSLLLDFEKKLRERLTLHGLKNDDMVKFFKEHLANKVYARRYEYFNNDEKRKEMSELEPFQMFYLKELIGLASSKGRIKLPDLINDNIRNLIMHIQNPIQHDNYEESELIYNFESFKKYFTEVIAFRTENRKLKNKLLLMKLTCQTSSSHSS